MCHKIHLLTVQNSVVFFLTTFIELLIIRNIFIIPKTNCAPSQSFSILPKSLTTTNLFPFSTHLLSPQILNFEELKI